MHPILFKIGSLNLPTYGFLLVMAILAAVYMVMRLGRREGLDPNRLLDFCTWLVLVGMVGAKVLMVVSDWSYYHQNPGEISSVSTLLSGGVFAVGLSRLFSSRRRTFTFTICHMGEFLMRMLRQLPWGRALGAWVALPPVMIMGNRRLPGWVLFLRIP